MQRNMWNFVVNHMEVDKDPPAATSRNDEVQRRLSQALYKTHHQKEAPQKEQQQQKKHLIIDGMEWDEDGSSSKSSSTPSPPPTLQQDPPTSTSVGLQPLLPRLTSTDDAVSFAKQPRPTTTASLEHRRTAARADASTPTDDAVSFPKPASYRGSKQPSAKAKAPVKGSNHNKQWEKMYAKLVDYRKQYGNSNVPVRYADDPPFGKWVSRQREMYSKNYLAKNRIQRLEAIGFQWRMGKPNPNLGGQAKYEEHWMSRYVQLVQYKEKFGDFRIPMDYHDKQFRGWVHKQRSAEIRKDLRADRKQLLADIGFWDDIMDYPMKNPYANSANPKSTMISRLFGNKSKEGTTSTKKIRDKERERYEAVEKAVTAGREEKEMAANYEASRQDVGNDAYPKPDQDELRRRKALLRMRTEQLNSLPTDQRRRRNPAAAQKKRDKSMLTSMLDERERYEAAVNAERDELRQRKSLLRRMTTEQLNSLPTDQRRNPAAESLTPMQDELRKRQRREEAMKDVLQRQEQMQEQARMAQEQTRIAQGRQMEEQIALRQRKEQGKKQELEQLRLEQLRQTVDEGMRREQEKQAMTKTRRLDGIEQVHQSKEEKDRERRRLHRLRQAQVDALLRAHQRKQQQHVVEELSVQGALPPESELQQITPTPACQIPLVPPPTSTQMPCVPPPQMYPQPPFGLQQQPSFGQPHQLPFGQPQQPPFVQQQPPPFGLQQQPSFGQPPQARPLPVPMNNPALPVPMNNNFLPQTPLQKQLQLQALQRQQLEKQNQMMMQQIQKNQQMMLQQNQIIEVPDDDDDDVPFRAPPPLAEEKPQPGYDYRNDKLSIATPLLAEEKPEPRDDHHNEPARTTPPLTEEQPEPQRRESPLSVVSPPLSDDDEPARKKKLQLRVDPVADASPDPLTDEHPDYGMDLSQLQAFGREINAPSVDEELRTVHKQLADLAAAAAKSDSLKPRSKRKACRFVVGSAMAPPTLIDIERPRLAENPVPPSGATPPPKKKARVTKAAPPPSLFQFGIATHPAMPRSKRRVNLPATITPDRPLPPVDSTPSSPTSTIALPMVVLDSSNTRKEMRSFEDLFVSAMNTAPAPIISDWKRKRGWSYVM